MKRKSARKQKRPVAKTVLRLPDLEVAKSSVLNSLSCPDAQRGYRHAIDEFVDWYCSEPRLSFSKTVVVGYRMHLESRHLAPGTINLRLGAVRRLACEAAECGLLSADLAAGIRRVKGVKKLGVRLGNWLTAEQGHALWQGPDTERLKGKRDRALLCILLACGLRRHEVAELSVDHLQQREGHWQNPCIHLGGSMRYRMTGVVGGASTSWNGCHCGCGRSRLVPRRSRASPSSPLRIWLRVYHALLGS